MSLFSNGRGEPKYEALEEAHLMDDIAGSEADIQMPRRQGRVPKLTTVVPWTISAVLLVLLGASWAFKWSEECGSSSFERGFSTELGKRTLFVRKLARCQIITYLFTQRN